MITVYEIKPNGFIGATKEIDPREGVGPGWTYTPPPADGAHKWVHGQWVAADEPLPYVPGPDFNALAADARAERSKRLAETDWMVTKAVEAGQPVPPEVLEYRQKLRDISQQTHFPLSVEWPELAAPAPQTDTQPE